MGKKALIDKAILVENGYRVAQVEDESNIYPVGEPIHSWQDCPDNIIADRFWFDPSDNSYKPLSIIQVPYDENAFSPEPLPIIGDSTIPTI